MPEIKYFKYPRTYHCPESKPGGDDRVLDNLDHFIGKEVVVTCKLDGENTTCYRDKIHARSLNSHHHPSRNWMKAFHSTFCYNIPEGYRICGENMQAKHAIYYENLPTYFFVFGVYDENNVCLSWDNTVKICNTLGLTTVPVLYRGIWDEDKVKACFTGRTIVDRVDVGEMEGYVVRIADSFSYDDHTVNTYKFVRDGHIAGDVEHWSKGTYTPNKLKS